MDRIDGRRDGIEPVVLLRPRRRHIGSKKTLQTWRVPVRCGRRLGGDFNFFRPVAGGACGDGRGTGHGVAHVDGDSRREFPRRAARPGARMVRGSDCHRPHGRADDRRSTAGTRGLAVGVLDEFSRRRGGERRGDQNISRRRASVAPRRSTFGVPRLCCSVIRLCSSRSPSEPSSAGRRRRLPAASPSRLAQWRRLSRSSFARRGR